MDGLNIGHFREHVVRPVLKYLDLWSLAAENLLIGTAITESRLHYLVQKKGPALSVFQMEPDTFWDLQYSWLTYRPELKGLTERLRGTLYLEHDKHLELVGNLYYATAMARVFYRRVKEALPDALDAPALAAYWKKYYNTRLGKGTVEGATPHFALAVLA